MLAADLFEFAGIVEILDVARAFAFAGDVAIVACEPCAVMDYGTKAFADVPPAKIELGYEHSIDSEFEGQRWTQDMTITDSCEQVRRQHVMFRRLLGEIA